MTKEKNAVNERDSTARDIFQRILIGSCRHDYFAFAYSNEFG